MKPRNFSERCKLFFFPILENKKQTLYMVIHFIINALS